MRLTDEVAFHSRIQNSPGEGAHAAHGSVQSAPSQEDVIPVATVSQTNTIIPKLVGVQGGRFLIPFGATYFTMLRIHVGPDQ